MTLLEIEAQARHDLHRDHASSRPLSDDYELIGLVGEAAFSKAFRQPMDLTRRPSGDKGVDFVVPWRMTVDVKTARKAFHLIHEAGKPFCDVYVLAEYDDATRSARLVGWEWGPVLRRAPTRDFGHGVVNHFIPREQLRPMALLGQRIMTMQPVEAF